ncbi:MAG: hypothetical protein P8Y67_10475 [Alphaproteobacteria bacterium]
MYDRNAFTANRPRSDMARGTTSPAHDQTKGRPGGRTQDNQAIDASIQRAVVRLVEVIDQETAALRSRQPIEHKEYNTRKAHGLLELDRALRMLDGQKPSDTTLQMLSTLREKLEVNQQVLSIHVQAVREIAGVIADTIREADSDGTYTRPYYGKD